MHQDNVITSRVYSAAAWIYKNRLLILFGLTVVAVVGGALFPDVAAAMSERSGG